MVSTSVFQTEGASSNLVCGSTLVDHSIKWYNKIMAKRKNKDKECPVCKSIFQYKRREQVYCSQDCYQSTVREAGSEEIVCKTCKKTFRAKKHERREFCSQSCSTIYNNKGVQRNLKSGKYIGAPLKECESTNCQSLTRNKYCSYACRIKQADEALVEKWIAGKESGSAKYTVKAFVKRFLLKRSEGQCEAIDSRTGERCTENRITGKGNTVLQIDHIDGNWENNTVENLRMICPTCHVLTETWGAGNMGNGRTWKKNYNQYEKKSG